jgi:hypothetical protein
LIISQMPSITLQASPLSIIDVLEIAAGLFALVLFSLSVYAWYKRKQPALIMISTAFLLFFFKTIIEFLSPTLSEDGFVNVLLDFAVLALFFCAIIIRPRRESPRGTKGATP